MKMPEFTNFSKHRDLIWRSKWIWPGILVTSAAVVTILFATNIQTPLRPIIGLWFLLACPGMSIVRIFDVQERLLEWVLAIVLSISLAGILATLMIYTSTWSAALELSVLVMVTLGGVLVQSLLNLRIIAWPTSEISMPLPRNKRVDAPIAPSIAHVPDIPDAPHIPKGKGTERVDAPIVPSIANVSDVPNAPNIPKRKRRKKVDAPIAPSIAHVPDISDALNIPKRKRRKKVDAAITPSIANVSDVPNAPNTPKRKRRKKQA